MLKYAVKVPFDYIAVKTMYNFYQLQIICLTYIHVQSRTLVGIVHTFYYKCDNLCEYYKSHAFCLNVLVKLKVSWY